MARGRTTGGAAKRGAKDSLSEGLNASWIAVQGAEKADVLEALELADTGEACEPYAGERFALADGADGWFFIVSNNVDWASDDLAVELSEFGLVLGVRISETVMYSGLTAARHGEVLWRVVHDLDAYDEEVVVEGEAPAELAAILERIQAEEDASDGGADYFFEAPGELSLAICGLTLGGPDDEFNFTKLSGGRAAPSRYPPPSAASQRGGVIGFLARIFWR